MTRVVLAALLIALSGGAAHAQAVSLPPPNAAKIVTLHAVVTNATIAPGDTTTVEVQAQVDPQYHIQSNKPTESYLVPTRLAITAPKGFSVSTVTYPAPAFKEFAFAKGKQWSVYEQSPVFTAKVSVPRGAKPGPATLHAKLTYQACNDSQCLPPSDASANVLLTVGPRTSAPQVASLVSPQPTAPPAENNRVEEIAKHGWMVLVLFIFVAGLALSLTPCVWPLIPVTLGYFRGQASDNKGRTLGLAFLYVGGIATTYSILGLIAASTGALFGSWLSNPYVLTAFALVIAAMALSMFGLFELQPPAFIASKSGAKAGYTGAFVMGLVFGIVAAPCTGPVTVALLGFVGVLGKPLLGFLLFFVLALGIATPLLILAIFSGTLPRSGVWMEWMKKLMGALMLGAAVWLINPVLGPKATQLVSAGLAVAMGIWLGFVEGSGFRPRTLAAARILAAAAGVGIGVWLLVPRTSGPEIAWSPYSQAAVQQARSNGKPVMVDFSATWCAPCHELEDHAFRDPEAVRLSQSFVRLRADVTHGGNPEVEEFRSQYGVRGVPTIVFLSPDGHEIPQARVLSNISGEELVERMKQAVQPSVSMR